MQEFHMLFGTSNIFSRGEESLLQLGLNMGYILAKFLRLLLHLLKGLLQLLPQNDGTCHTR